mgnify:CR=1 FL=1
MFSTPHVGFLHGLRQFFLAHLRSGFKFVANPNTVEDIKAANLRELDRAIALANDPKYRDVILTVSVGNENIVDFSADRIDPADMAVYIKYVRDRVKQPVTTDDNFQVFTNPIPKAVLDQIDFVAIHAYPVIDTEFPNSPLYWDWKQLAVPAGPARATAMMDASIAELKKQYQASRLALDSVGLGRMPIVITETGWKARITGDQAFRAHPVNQKMYFQRLETWRQESRVSGNGPVNIFYFEAFDEPWKLSDDGWGLFNKDRKARYVVQNLYPQAIWENASLTDADAVYFLPPTINPDFAGRFSVRNVFRLVSFDTTVFQFDPTHQQFQMFFLNRFIRFHMIDLGCFITRVSQLFRHITVVCKQQQSGCIAV